MSQHGWHVSGAEGQRPCLTHLYIFRIHHGTRHTANIFLEWIKCIYHIDRASLVAQTVKNPPAMQKTWVRSLGWDDPLAEGMSTHSSIIAWRIPTNRGAWQAIVLTWTWIWMFDWMDMNERLNTAQYISFWQMLTKYAF